MATLSYFVEIIENGQVYKVPVFAAPPKAAPLYQQAQREAYVDAFVNGPHKITLNGVAIDTSTALAQKLIGASLKITALSTVDDLFSKDGDLQNIAGTWQGWRGTLVFAEEALEREFRTEAEEGVTDAQVVAAATIAAIGLAIAGGPITLVALGAGLAVTALGTSLNEFLAEEKELIAGKTALAAVDQQFAIALEAREALADMLNGLSESGSLSNPSAAFAGQTTTLQQIDQIYNQTVSTIAIGRAAEIAVAQLGEVLGVSPANWGSGALYSSIASDINAESFLERVGTLANYAPLTQVGPVEIAASVINIAVNTIEQFQSSMAADELLDFVAERGFNTALEGASRASTDIRSEINLDLDFGSSALQRVIADLVDAAGGGAQVGDASSYYDPVPLIDTDNDGVPNVRAAIEQAGGRDYYSLSLEEYSIYRIILGGDELTDIMPDFRVLDAATGREIDVSTKAAQKVVTITFSNEDARDIIIEVSSDTLTSYEMFVRREDGPRPDKWDPSFDDYANSIDDDARPLGQILLSDDDWSGSGVLAHGADHDVFRIQVEEGYEYSFEAASPDTQSIRFDILNEDGRILERSSGGFIDKADIIADYTGDMFVRVANGSRERGDVNWDYTLFAERQATSRLNDTVGESFAEAQSISLGGSVTGAIDYDGDVDMFSVNLGSSSAQKYFEFRLFSLESGKEVRFDLYDENRERVRDDGVEWYDRSLGDGWSGVYFKGDPGRVYVEVEGRGDPVNYRLEVFERPSGDIPDNRFTPASLQYVTAEDTGTVSGGNPVIDAVGDVDWFRVDVDAKTGGGFYSYFTNFNGNAADAVDRLVVADGRSVKEAGLSESSDSFTAHADGTIFLEAYYGSGIGSYAPEVVRYDDDHANDRLNATELSFGGSAQIVATGRSEINEDYDVFKLSLLAKQEITIELLELDGNNSDDVRFELLSATGVELDDGQDDSGNMDLDRLSDGIFVSEVDQDIYIAVYDGPDDLADGAINYRLTIGDLGGTDAADDTVAQGAAVSAVAASDGQTLNGYLNGAGDVDYVKLRLAANTIYSFDANDGGSDYREDPSLALFDLSGTPLLGEDHSFEREAGATDDLNAYVTGGSAQDVLLRVASFDYVDFPDDVGEWEVAIRADAVNGTRSPGQTWSESLSGSGGEKHYLADIPKGYGVILSIDNYRAPLGDADVFDGDNILAFDHLREVSNGELSDGDSSPGEVLLYQPFDDQLGLGRSHFELDWDANEAGSFTLHMSNLIELDTSGGAARAQAGNDGRHYVEDLTQVVAVGETVHTTYNLPYEEGGQDGYRVALEQGQTYDISVSGRAKDLTFDRSTYDIVNQGEITSSFAALDPANVTLRVLDSRLNEVASFNAASPEAFTPTTDGDYFITMTVAGSVSGGYEFSVTETGAGPAQSDDRGMGDAVAADIAGVSGDRLQIALSGTFEIDRDVDTVVIDAKAGSVYRLDPALILGGGAATLKGIFTADGIPLADQPYLGALDGNMLRVVEDTVLHLDLTGPVGAWDTQINALIGTAAGTNAAAPVEIDVAGGPFAEDTATIPVSLTLSADPEGDAFDLRLLYDPRAGVLETTGGVPISPADLITVSGGAATLPDGSTLGVDSLSTALHFVPNADVDGVFFIEVQVEDSFGAQQRSTATFEITPAEDAPDMTPLLEGTTFEHTQQEQRLGLGVPVDADGDLLYVRVDALPDSVAAISLGKTASPGDSQSLLKVGDRLDATDLSELFVYSKAGEQGANALRLTAVDGTGNEASRDIVFTSSLPTPPVLAPIADISVAENAPAETVLLAATAVDPGAGDVQWSLTGADAARFSIDTAGQVFFNASPDFETPTDTDTDNDYEITIRATDASGGIDSESVTVTVTDVDETEPLPDLQHTGFAITRVALGELDVQYSLVNLGEGAAPASVLKLFWTEDQLESADDVYIGQYTFDPIAGNGTVVRRDFTLTGIPTDTVGPNGYVYAIIDADDLIAESDETNNSTAFEAPSGDLGGFKSVPGLGLGQGDGAPEVKLIDPDGAAGDNLGRSVAISGNIAVTTAHLDDDNGTDSGSVVLFDVTTGAHLRKLTASDGVAYDYFGSSVAIAGNKVLVGANDHNVSGSKSGAAYLFDADTGAHLLSDTLGETFHARP